MNYIVRKTEPFLWTVGRFYSNEWYPESDHESEYAAKQECQRLNGIINEVWVVFSIDIYVQEKDILGIYSNEWKAKSVVKKNPPTKYYDRKIEKFIIQ